VDILELRRYYNGQQACSSVLRSIQAASSCLFQLAYALLRGVPSSSWSGGDGRVPALSASSESGAKGTCNMAKLADRNTTLAARRTMPKLCIPKTTSHVLHAFASARFIKHDQHWAPSMAVDCEAGTSGHRPILHYGSFARTHAR
jgi:hypothetical protein